MSNPVSMHSAQAQRSPGRLGPPESWRHRILFWVYPNRGWGGEGRTVEREYAGKEPGGLPVARRDFKQEKPDSAI
jgi:hypothetical protein